MVATHDIKTFSKGEDVQFTMLLKNRDGTPLSDAATQVVNFVISKKLGGAIIAEFNTTPEITLADALTANWTVKLLRADLTLLEQKVDYEYNVWSTSATSWRILQITGTLTLLQADSPA